MLLIVNNQEICFVFSRLSGMRTATTLSEWQLQAVLYNAKLTQYFETFISQVFFSLLLMTILLSINNKFQYV